jgi:hypothetical protein
MRVVYSRSLMDKFRAEAKRIFPKEAFAVLLGRRGDDSVRVTQLYIPEAQEKSCTRTKVHRANAWLGEARRLADTAGIDVLGEIHSHAETSVWQHDRAPSEVDWDRAADVSVVHGICSVRKYPSGRMVALVKFWPARLDLTEKITD